MKSKQICPVAGLIYLQRVLLALIVVLPLSNGYSQRATGLNFDDESYERVRAMSPAQNFSTAGDPVYSLRSFCPIPGNQGSMGSCVGWSVAYGALTTAKANTTRNKNRAAITGDAYSALFLYNQVKSSDCSNGANLDRAFEFLKNTGTCKAREFNPDDCYTMPDQKLINIAKQNRISSYLKLFQLDATPDTKIAMTIQELQHDRPVVIGMRVTRSFDMIGKDGIWTPEENEVYTGGHAMCVVGYDNLQERFEILNSWGTDFGDGGYVYVSYKDYGKYCKYGYTFKIEENKPEDIFTFKGSFYINKMVKYNKETREYTYERIDGLLEDDHYTLNNGKLKLNSYFRIMASEMEEGNALYIFSIKPDGSGELLFPTKSETSFGISLADDPIILDEDSYIELPAEKAYKADQAGDDSLVFLYCKQELDDPDGLVNRVASESGDIMARLTSVIGDKLVPVSDIKYEQETMQFYGASGRGSVVPVLLKVKINP